ncbi:hypothetical protein LV564_13450 [Komagataeibacter nataicola]|uniref:hypothetical protein n=1 Tax=Komagataeibacter nataicola TaxID=265960 RepID=UPI00125DD0A5|nr:hypothetical protein [Komagataeibacter nataicola]WEQ55102.1 hypothetical protein LV564_13450 [Komagataeibacter nataicola]WNM09981.1 hypothetical protein RI056_09200 [Komagataeibacter nataicola]
MPAIVIPVRDPGDGYGSDMVGMPRPRYQDWRWQQYRIFSAFWPERKGIADSFLARDDFLAPLVTDRNETAGGWT